VGVSRYHYLYITAAGSIDDGAMSERLTPIKQKVLEIMKSTSSPIRFTDLMNELSRSKKRVADHINELEAVGFIQKIEDGRYVLTEKGKEALETTELKENAEESFRLSRSHVPPEKAALLGTLYTYFFGGPTSAFDTYMDQIHRATPLRYTTKTG